MVVMVFMRWFWNGIDLLGDLCWFSAMGTVELERSERLLLEWSSSGCFAALRRTAKAKEKGKGKSDGSFVGHPKNKSGSGSYLQSVRMMWTGSPLTTRWPA